MAYKKSAAKAAPATTEDGAALKAVRVRAVGQASRYRIGRQFGPEAVEIPAGDIDQDGLAALLSDPLLAVELIGA